MRPIEDIIKDIELRKTELTETRDRLRELEDEVCGLRYSAEEAVDSLGEAIDRLSELI